MVSVRYIHQRARRLVHAWPTQTELTRLLGIEAPIVPGAVGRPSASELVEPVRAGRGHDLVPFGGQTAGLIDGVLPVREIVETMVRDAAQRLAAFRGPPRG